MRWRPAGWRGSEVSWMNGNSSGVNLYNQTTTFVPANATPGEARILTVCRTLLYPNHPPMSEPLTFTGERYVPGSPDAKGDCLGFANISHQPLQWHEEMVLCISAK